MSDFAERLEQARATRPLRTLMATYGKGPANQNWKTFPHCPYCQHAGSSGVFPGKSGELFKCHYTSCSTGGKALDEVGFLMRELNLGDSKEGWKAAAVELMKLAGVWQEPAPRPRKPLGRNQFREIQDPQPPAVRNQSSARRQAGAAS